MTLGTLDFVSLIITALLVPTVGGMVWIVKKLIQASIDHTSELTAKFDALNASLQKLVNVVTAHLEKTDAH